MTIERMADMENRTRQLPTRMHKDSDDFRLIQVRAQVLQETTYEGWRRVKAEFERQLKNAKQKDVCIYQYGISVANGELGDKAGAYRAAKASAACGIQSAVIDRNLIRMRFDAASGAQEKLAALAQAKAALNKYPLSVMMAENYVDLLFALGRHQEIIAYLENGKALSDGNPDYHAMLARSYEALGKKSLQYMHTGEMYAQLGATEAAVYQYDLAQKANDGDFYTMSEIDARLRQLRSQLADERKDR